MLVFGGPTAGRARSIAHTGADSRSTLVRGRLVHRAEVAARRRPDDAADELRARRRRRARGPSSRPGRRAGTRTPASSRCSRRPLLAPRRTRRSCRSPVPPRGGCRCPASAKSWKACSCSRMPSTVTARRSFSELLLFGAAETGTAPASNATHITSAPATGRDRFIGASPGSGRPQAPVRRSLVRPPGHRQGSGVGLPVRELAGRPADSLTKRPAAQLEVEAVEVHDLVPRRHEVADELVARRRRCRRPRRGHGARSSTRRRGRRGCRSSAARRSPGRDPRTRPRTPTSPSTSCPCRAG